ncbi:unnamed protein product [Effrenium voratum]|uniref:Uncharacterized protein n=1 Tax=Effrenium voratum TaxID=2562239 RepID=A0AA36NAN8_9DINO|nr:unnamed protein product [Effrenium voratum]
MRTLALVISCWTGAHASLQKSFALSSAEALSAKEAERCELSREQKWQEANELRAAQLQSSSKTQEKRLGDLHLQLMGKERPTEEELNLDQLGAALQRRQADIDHLLQATEAAIARKKAAFVPAQ